jgi:hypothetical protein
MIKRGIHTRASRQLQVVIFVLWFLRVRGPDNALVRGGVRDAGGRGGVRHGVRQGRRRGASLGHPGSGTLLISVGDFCLLCHAER